MKRSVILAGAGVLCLIALSGCSAIFPTPESSHGPCASDPSCTRYSGTTAEYHGHNVSWISAHPISAEYYATGSQGEFVANGPCNAPVNLAVTISGSTLTPDTSHVSFGAEGCADDSQTAQREAVFNAVLLSKHLTGTIDTATKSITFSAGTNSITFVPA